MEQPSFTIANAILGGTAVLIFTCLYLLFAHFDQSMKEVINQLKVMNSHLASQVEKLGLSIDLTDHRIDMFDRLISNVSDEKFNSKLVARQERPEPSLDHLREIMREFQKGSHV